MFNLAYALSMEPKILSNGMKSFDRLRQLAGNPKIDEFFVDAVHLAQLLPGLPFAGDSALDRFSMLADNGYCTYAVPLSLWNRVGGLERKGESDISIQTRRQDLLGLSVIEIWLIEPPTVKSGCGDVVIEPLHLALSYYNEKRLFDERISLELGYLLERFGYEFEDRWN